MLTDGSTNLLVEIMDTSHWMNKDWKYLIRSKETKREMGMKFMRIKNQFPNLMALITIGKTAWYYIGIPRASKSIWC